MNPWPDASSKWCKCAIPVFLSFVFLLACTPPVERPKGPAADYAEAKDVFKKGRLDRVINLTDGLAETKPPDQYALQARVLRTVVFSGQIKTFDNMADSYQKGQKAVRQAGYAANYRRARQDALQMGGNSALGLGEVAQQFIADGSLPKELVLDAPWPEAEGPEVVEQLKRVRDGGRISPEDQDAAALAASRKGIDDALAEIVNGDRAKARTALAAGPVKLNGVDFAIFLDQQVLSGAKMFDGSHLQDPEKLKTMCGLAESITQQALALLKESPNKDQEKAVKKLQGEIKKTMRTA
jgi:hypothetical protein